MGAGKNGGGGSYYLYSGDISSVPIPQGPNIILIAHTHPGGSLNASTADREWLLLNEALSSPQKKSMIVTPEGQIAFFTKDILRADGTKYP